MPWRDDPAKVRPMLASTGDPPLDSPALSYEPKYDGIRAIAAVDPPSKRAASSPPTVRLWSRLGNEKTSEYPEIVEVLRTWGQNLRRPVVLDGEIVALSANGEPVSFLHLQGRMHLGGRGRHIARTRAARDFSNPDVAFIAFDLLRDGDDDLRARPLRQRRARLERLFGGAARRQLRISEQACGNGRPLLARALANGWEGLVAKRLDSVYVSGRRTTDWRKLKLIRTQSCVVGGWTAPRGSRLSFGALLLGIYDVEARLQYVGSVGSGFSDADLRRVAKRLRLLESLTCPFATPPRTAERPTWVEPRLVAEVKFTEWTLDGMLRHPTFLGIRDDVTPERVHKEPDTIAARQFRVQSSESRIPSPGSRVPSPGSRAPDPEPRISNPGSRAPDLEPRIIADLLLQIDTLEASGRDGVLRLPAGERLEVTNLGKVFWPEGSGRVGGGRKAARDRALTKGDLFRHYVRVAPFILPILTDRALVMKRYPNGVTGESFYQHRAPDRLPAGVRVATLRHGSKNEAYVVGGSLITLLYMAQLATISQDPWFSRVGADDEVDHVAIDLDPPDGVPFGRVLDVARWVHEELVILGAPAFPKTSGADGLHIYVPVPPGTPQRAGLLFCQIVATIVATKHPSVATVERSVATRGRRIYVDCLQNARGKTLASAYSARASEFAGVSTPVTWEEIDHGVSPRDFSVRNFEKRLDEVGDLWAQLRGSKGADLRALTKR